MLLMIDNNERQILQAIAPAFIGGFSDTAGRRPAYIICFVVYIAADIALALQNNYVALLVLRMVQSGGSSGTVSVANAVVADVDTVSNLFHYSTLYDVFMVAHASFQLLVQSLFLFSPHAPHTFMPWSCINTPKSSKS
jgi:MFS family permease